MIESSFLFGIVTFFWPKNWSVVISTSTLLHCYLKLSDQEWCVLTFTPLLSGAVKFGILSSPKILLQLFEGTLFFHWINLKKLHAMYQGAILPSEFCLFLSAEMSEILKSKNRPKIQFAMESDKQHFRLFVNMCSFH